MKKLFLDIDTQYDFINPDDALYVKGADTIIENLKRLTEYAVDNNIPIISTLDTHTKDDPEFKDFPPHCIYGTKGHKKIEETVVNDALVIHYEDNELILNYNYKNRSFLKPSYDAFSNPLFEIFIQKYRGDEIIVYGVATDICIKATASGLLGRKFNVTIVEDAVMGGSEETALKAIESLKSKGASFKRTEEIVK